MLPLAYWIGQATGLFVSFYPIMLLILVIANSYPTDIQLVSIITWKLPRREHLNTQSHQIFLTCDHVVIQGIGLSISL